ncbi:MAG: hypothetical protein LBK23_00640 [Oscillospiraceae bacterium]|jgi:hypothetical protein|nr:hypothetical protein [Oscillospiraceae bacterium]
MENKFRDTRDAAPETAARRKKEIGLPLIALALDIVPILLYVVFIASGSGAGGLETLFTILLPLAGIVTGVTALGRGKDRIGTAGKTLAIIAIVLPLIPVALIVVLAIGAMTGVISLM